MFKVGANASSATLSRVASGPSTRSDHPSAAPSVESHDAVYAHHSPRPLSAQAFGNDAVSFSDSDVRSLSDQAVPPFLSDQVVRPFLSDQAVQPFSGHAPNSGDGRSIAASHPSSSLPSLLHQVEHSSVFPAATGHQAPQSFPPRQDDGSMVSATAKPLLRPQSAAFRQDDGNFRSDADLLNASALRFEEVIETDIPSSLRQALLSSPFLQAMFTTISQLKRTVETETTSFSQQLASLLGPQVQGDALMAEMESAERRLLMLQKQVQTSEQRFFDAKLVEIERFHKVHSSQAPRRAAALKNSTTTSTPAAPASMPDLRPAHSLLRSQPSPYTREKDLRRFDNEERQAIKDSMAVGAESRSPDSVAGRRTDVNGYVQDDFVVSDRDDSLSFSSDTESTDDNSCTDASEDAKSTESKGQRAVRLEIIAKAMFKTKSKASCKANDHRPAIHLSATGAELATIRSTDIRVKRRTPRTPVIELILNRWLHCGVSEISVDHVAEFLRLLKLIRPEYAISVYYVLVKRIRPLSISLFKFLYRCIVEYLPEHKQAFCHAFRNVVDKEVKLARKSPPPAANATPSAAPASMKVRPTLRPPSIDDTSNIAYAVGKFYNEYRAYARDHHGQSHRTMFQCFLPDQAAAFATVVMRSEDDLDSMPVEDFMEVWRTAFGLQSSASVLAALSTLQFKGDVLNPSSWADWYRRFMLVVKQAPMCMAPPQKTMAKKFVQGCPSAFVRDGLVAYESQTVDEALQLVIARLKDHGFVRAATTAIARERLDTHPRQTQPAVKLSASGPPPPSRRRDHHDGDNDQGGQAIARHEHRTDQRPRQDPALVELSRRQPDRQPVSPAAVICKRCGKPGHAIDACISRHDASGKKLEHVDADVYAKRKENAIRISEARQTAKPKVLGVADASSSGTEDIDGLLSFEDALSECDEIGCNGVFDCTHLPELYGACCISPVDEVPPPSLLIDGDVEPNPGPQGKKRRQFLLCTAPARNARNTLVLSPGRFIFELSGSPAVAGRTTSPMPHLPALVMFFLFALYWFWPYLRPRSTVAKQSPPCTSQTKLDPLCCAATGKRFETTLVPDGPPAPAPWDTDDPRRSLIPRLLLLRVLVILFLLLLRCGDIEANPGPYTSESSDDEDLTPLQLAPSALRRPPASFFGPRLPKQLPPAVAAIPTDSDFYTAPEGDAADTITASSTAQYSVPPMPPLISDSEHDSDSVICDDSFEQIGLNAILHYESSDPDTSDVDNPAPVAVVASASPCDPLLAPPKFVGFLVPTATDGAPPFGNAQICAIDTMCQGEYSVISRALVKKLALPTTPFSRTSRTASGSLVHCTHLAKFYVAIFVHDAWMYVPATALVWEHTAEPLLLCNLFALNSGLIDFVRPNAERTAIYGDIVFSTQWRQKLDAHSSGVLAAYHEDVMPEELDDVVDLSAPLRCGDQDISALPEDALAYARKYPEMTKAIPRDAHPELDKWVASVDVSKIPLYSWPASDLKDLKEDRLPLRVAPALHQEFDKLIALHYAEELTACPTAVVMRAQLVAKSKTEKRFCVNGSVQKMVLHVCAYPMPHIRSIFHFVSSFPFRAKIDAKHGYHNFDIHPDSRKWTTTIGAGRAIQWRKLVQGFAPSGAFFQYAMVKLLGDLVWKIVAVYLDDLIIVGRTRAECAANVATVMARLAYFCFRINFAKCVFTPSPNIDFLGCRLEGTKVLPGPKVPNMLAKIKPPHTQHTPKAQRHHLHVFLGCCAFILQHCPGLKQVLAPLYLSVASEPFRYGDLEKRAFDDAMRLLQDLKPYFLPSDDADISLEVMTDASGGAGTPLDPGAWSAVLGQRRGPFTVERISENFELLQSDGGLFNARQAVWDILRKEAWAVFQALLRFRPFIFGRKVRIIIDSKVLLHLYRSEVSMLKRWFAYIQTFDYDIVHVDSNSNALADCLSRCVYVPPQAAPSAPRLLQVAKHVPAQPLQRSGDIETNPGPPVVSTAQTLPHVASRVPAPSLLRCGDVEPNPGPSSDEDVIWLGSSDDDAPIVAPVTRSTSRTPSARQDDSSAGGGAARPNSNSAPATTKRPDTRPSPPSASDSADAADRVLFPRAETAVSPAVQRRSKAAARPAARPAVQTPARAKPAADSPVASSDQRQADTAASGLTTQPVQQPLETGRRQLPAPAVAAPVPVAESSTERLSQELQAMQPAVGGHDESWPEVTVSFKCCRTDPSTSALCTAIASALKFEAEQADRVMRHAPPQKALDIREQTMWFMSEYANTLCDIRLNLSVRGIFRQLHDSNALFMRFDHREEEHAPTTWSEYQSLMAELGTYPDMVFLHAAARLYRCQVILFLEGDAIPYIVCAPPEAFRRIYLLSSNNMQHVNWGATPARDERDRSRFHPFTFRAPPLVNPPVSFTLQDDKLHKLYNRLPVNEERLRQIHTAHCGYSGHPGVKATVMLLIQGGMKWRGMTADVAQFIRRCPTCCASRQKLHYATVSASSLRLHARPLSRWHIDQTGTFQECLHTGFNRLIVFICETTQFCVIFGSRFGSALEIAVALIHLIGWFNLPESLHSDHGSENENYIWHQFQHITGIKHTFSLPRAPESNGIAERNIATAKRFVNSLCVDMGRHTAWGLLLPVAQKGMNDLPREELSWHSPSDIVFAACKYPENFAIPTFYSRPLRELDLSNANEYHVAGNFAHRAMCFQQHVLNRFHEIKERAFDAAEAANPTPREDLRVGQAVLIDWPHGRQPASPVHPRRRGPYVVEEVQRNYVMLRHLTVPAPDGQPAALQWTKHAHVYTYTDAALPQRDERDPSSSLVAASFSGRQIECVLSHTQITFADPLTSGRHNRHVSNFKYNCRMFSSPRPVSDSRQLEQMLCYDDIKHTYAFDLYVQAHRSLVGHVPVSHMPLNWDPRAVKRSDRPAFRAGPIHEADFCAAFDSDTSSVSDADSSD